MSEFQKCEETKVFRDPIHGYIHVDLQLIWDIINSDWFQRLRRIHQLGGAYFVYHCAEHSRFGHSLGVYEIARRMTIEVKDINEALSEYEKVLLQVAALLHDIGHGPFSHAFESISNTSHEAYSCRIIEEDTSIHRLIEKAHPGMSKDVAAVIQHRYHNPLISQLISSQLDADRMDYLLRDAYFTGTKYGEFDLERIMRTLRVHNNEKIVTKESGVYAIENYIMARYHMYWQIYFHPVTRSFEMLFDKLFERLQDIKQLEDSSITPELKAILEEGDIPLDMYFRLDEVSLNYAFHRLMEHQDPIVKDLAEMVRDRKLFKYVDQNEEDEKRIIESLIDHGYDPKYYLGKVTIAQGPYVPYQGEGDNSIWIRMKDGTIKELSEASKIVSSLVNGPTQDDNKLFYKE